MANHLRMAMIQAIVTLHQRGWSNRRIARELGVDRGAVSRHLEAANAVSGLVNPPLGSDVAGKGAADSKPATAASNPPLGSEADFTGILSTAEGEREGSKPTSNPPPGSAGLEAGTVVMVGPPSDCQPYRAIIEEKLSHGLSGLRIYQDLAAEHGAGPGNQAGWQPQLRQHQTIPAALAQDHARTLPADGDGPGTGSPGGFWHRGAPR